MAPPAFAALKLSTDNRQLSFGRMELGETKELAQFGSYHNEITCSSTNGVAWYLKVQVLGPLASGDDTIPLENFRWQLVSLTTGKGTIAKPYRMTPFQLTPDLVYLSGPDEVKGTEVPLQLKYSLTIPETQISGNYQTIIRFTMMEIL